MKRLTRDRWVMPALLLLAFALRLPGLARPQISDEGLALRAVSGSLSGLMSEALLRDAHPPLYFLLLRLWGLLSHELWWLRLLSVACGVLSCWLVYRIGCTLFTVAVGRWACLIAGFSPLLILISQTLRPYALAIALSSGSALAAAHLLRAQHPATLHRWLFIYGLLQGLNWYVYYPSILIAIALNSALAWGFIRWERWKLLPWLLTLAALALAYLPWLPVYAQQMSQLSSGASSTTPLLKDSGMGFFIGRIQVGAIAKALLSLWQVNELQVSSVRLSAHLPAAALLFLAAAGAGLLFISLLTGWRGLSRTSRQPTAAGLMITGSILPIGWAAALSVAGDLGWAAPLAVNVRYFGESAAMMSIVMAGALKGLRAGPWRRSLVLAGACAFLLQLPYLYRYPFNLQAGIIRILEENPKATAIVSMPRDLRAYLDKRHQQEIEERYDYVLLSPDHLEEAMTHLKSHEQFHLFQMTSAEWLVRFPELAERFDALARAAGYTKSGERSLSDALRAVSYHRQGMRVAGGGP